MKGFVAAREQARALGLKHFFTGEPCRRGHVCERHVSNKMCVECLKILARDHYSENAERKAALVKAWAVANRDARRAFNRNRDARARGAKGGFTPEDVKLILAEQRGRCPYCRNPITLKTGHVDHIVALTKGGSNHPHNLQLTCGSCNSRKNNKCPIKFGLAHGRLNGRIALAKIMSIMGE